MNRIFQFAFSKLRGVKVYALVGRSGTGKSYHSKLVAAKHHIDLMILRCSMTFTPAGMKKKAILERRKSLFSFMWSIFSIPENSAAARRIIAVIEEGKGKGRIALIASPRRHKVNIIAI